MSTEPQDTAPRYSISLTPEYREQIASLAKTHKLTQGEVIGVLCEFAHDNAGYPLEAMLKSKRAQKVAERQPKNAAYRAFMALTPAQREALLAKAPAQEG